MIDVTFLNERNLLHLFQGFSTFFLDMIAIKFDIDLELTYPKNENCSHCKRKCSKR